MRRHHRDTCIRHRSYRTSEFVEAQRSIVQKYTTVWGFAGALPNALTTPVSAPARTLASFRALSSPRSSRLISTFFRRTVWKSSSSAPASRPVPNNVATALPSPDSPIRQAKHKNKNKNKRRERKSVPPNESEITRKRVVVLTYFAQRAVPGEVRRFSAQFARASVGVHALAVVSRTRAREVAAA
jgi:hypothetical protein